MTNGSDSNEIMKLTVADVRGWQAENESIDAQVEQLLKRKEGNNAKLKAAELLFPSLFVQEDPPKSLDGLVRKRSGRATWTSLIEEQVRLSGDGIRQKDLMDRLREGPFGARLKSSESGYYNAIQKLLKREILIKRGDWLFTRVQHDEYQRRLARGEVDDFEKAASYGSPAAAEIVRFVTANPGRKSIDLIRAVWKAHSGDHPPSKTSLYNMIARLVEQRHIRKTEGRFYVCEGNEPSASDEGDGSEADGDAAPSNESQQRFRVIG